MLYNTWIFSWLITMVQFIVYFLLFHTTNVIFLMMVFLFTFLLALPALIPFSIFWIFLKRRSYTRPQILARNILAAVIVGACLGIYPSLVATDTQFDTGHLSLWPYFAFPAIGGALAVWLNQKEIYKGLQSHFETHDILDTIYE